MWCSFDTLVGSNEQDVHGSAILCKRWTCDHCFQIRCAQLRELAEAGRAERFITLTASDDAGDDDDEVARLLVHSWRMVVQAAKRAGLIKRISYLAVFEETKRGRPHLHILQRGGYLPKAWLSAQMALRMKSPIIDIQRVKRAGQAARYVSKYVSKMPHRWQGTKRYWRTMDWRLAECEWREKIEKTLREWSRVSSMWFNVATDLEARGYLVKYVSDRRWIAERCSSHDGPGGTEPATVTGYPRTASLPA